MVQSNIPPTFEKKLRKNVKTKNKGVNTGSELRAPFKVIFSIFRKKDGKTKKLRKMTKLTRKRKRDHIVKSKFRPSFKVKLKRKKTFQLVLFKLDSFTFCPLQILLRLRVHIFRGVLFRDIERSGLSNLSALQIRGGMPFSDHVSVVGENDDFLVFPPLLQHLKVSIFIKVSLLKISVGKP